MNRICIATCLLVGTALAARAEPEARAGTLVLSTGEEIAGTIRLTEGKRLEIFVTDEKKRYRLALAELAGLTVEIESERMQDGWMFVEEGSDKKIKLPFRYPLRAYRTVVRLATGQVLRGHAVGVIYVAVTGGDERRFLLLADQKGEKGQQLADLVYVRAIRFPDATSPPGEAKRLAVLEAVLPGADEVTVVDIDRDRGSVAESGSPEGRFRCPGLLPGAYDVFARAPSALYGALTVPPGTAAAALTDGDRDDLRDRIGGIEEFYDEKRIVAVAGGRERAKILLELRRTRPTTLKEEGTGASRFIRWEVWTLHRLERTWQIDARIFLFRARLPPDAEFPRVEYHERAELGGVRIAGTKEIETLRVDLCAGGGH